MTNEPSEKQPGTTIVYHYTDIDALLKIVEGRTIWATCINYLNDTSERTHYLRLVRKQIRARHLPFKEATPLGPPEVYTIFSDLMNEPHSDDEVEIRQFVTSFRRSLTRYHSGDPTVREVTVSQSVLVSIACGVPKPKSPIRNYFPKTWSQLL
jgi:hypothetical protein